MMVLRAEEVYVFPISGRRRIEDERWVERRRKKRKEEERKVLEN
jgi:hypothetical protein